MIILHLTKFKFLFLWIIFIIILSCLFFLISERTLIQKYKDYYPGVHVPLSNKDIVVNSRDGKYITEAEEDNMFFLYGKYVNISLINKFIII